MPAQLRMIPTVPAETARTAKAVFGGTNFYIRVGEQMESILGNAELERLSGIGECLQTAAAILPLVTFFQFVEGLTDEQVMDAFRVRMDWKFALHLPVHVPVFAEDALCRFRYKVLGDRDENANGEIAGLIADGRLHATDGPAAQHRQRQLPGLYRCADLQRHRLFRG